MNVVLDPDVAQWVDQEARRTGVAPETYIAQRLRDQHELAQQFSTLPDDEATLLARVNEGLSEDFWKRYQELIARREERNLSPAEQTELISLSDRIEQKNAERAPYLIALARLRGIPLPELIRQLGLRPRSVQSS